MKRVNRFRYIALVVGSALLAAGSVTPALAQADAGDTQQMDWDRLIQTLDRGSFNVGQVLSSLRRAGYTGPIGLQSYGIPGDNRENLKRSMKAWREIRARTAEE